MSGQVKQRPSQLSTLRRETIRRTRRRSQRRQIQIDRHHRSEHRDAA
jgi:hypothetical protein